MSLPPTKHLLPFDPVMQVIESGLHQLPPWVVFHIDIPVYVRYLLEWLSVKIEDPLAETAADLAATYLKSKNIEQSFAHEMSHEALNAIVDLVGCAFPNLTYLELSQARFVMEDPFTLAVHLNHPIQLSHAQAHY